MPSVAWLLRTQRQGRLKARSLLTRNRFRGFARSAVGSYKPLQKRFNSDCGYGAGPNIIRPFSRMNKSPVPPFKVVALKYVDTERTLSVGAGGVTNGSQVYRLNSLFDPQFGVGGGGPVEWFSSMSVFYRKYIIWSVDYEVKFFHPTQDTLVAGVQIQPSEDTDDIGSAKTSDYMMERRNVATASLTSTSGQGSYRVIRGTINLPRLQGLSWMQYNMQTEVFGSVVTANPTLTPWMRVACADADGQNTGSVKCVVSLIFHGKMYAATISP